VTLTMMTRWSRPRQCQCLSVDSASALKVCEAARKAGVDRVIVDGVVIVLSPAAPAESNGNEFDEWMAKHAH
jgi:hypothetical protein